MSMLSKMRQPSNQKEGVQSSYIALPDDSTEAAPAIQPVFFTGENNIVIRSFMDTDGIIWFIAQDFLKIIGYPDWTYEEPVIRRYFTSVPSNYGRSEAVLVKTEDGQQEARTLYCVNEKGIRMFLERIWQPAVKNILTLIDSDIVPFFHKIVVTREFLWNRHIIRSTQGTNSTVWFILSDVLHALGYSGKSFNSLGNLCSSLPHQHKQQRIIITQSGGSYPFFCLDSAGLKTFLNSSKKHRSMALAFLKWIAEEVLPVWRRRGTYEEPVFPKQPPRNKAYETEAVKRWNRIAYQPTDDDPVKEEYKQAVALQAARAETGGIHRPMWLVAGRTVTFDQLVTMIHSYWLDYRVDRQSISLWMRQNGYLEPAYKTSNIPTALSKKRGLFEPYTYTKMSEDSEEAHLKADVKVTDVGVEYFTTLCAQGEQFGCEVANLDKIG